MGQSRMRESLCQHYTSRRNVLRMVQFTGDHGLPLLEDAHCLRGLSLLIQLIRNGQLSEQCRTYLLSCPVIPTAKRTGGIRPITIGETLYKMAAALALSDVTEAVDGPD